jgi:hypothetical protein
MSKQNDPKSQHDDAASEAERRKQQSIQDKQNQSRADHRRPDQTHGTHNQADKQIAPEQRSQDSK